MTITTPARVGSRKDRDHLAATLAAMAWLIGFIEGTGQKVPSWIHNVRNSGLHQLEFVERERATKEEAT